MGQSKEWKQRNPEKLQAQKARYRERHPNAWKEWSERRSEEDRERARIRARESVRKYHENNKERIKERRREIRQGFSPEQRKKFYWGKCAVKNYKRALGFGVQAERVSYRKLYENRPEKCPLCLLPMPEDLVLDIDHRIPLAEGGSHTESNLQVIHMWCHRRKTQGEAPGPPIRE